MPDWAEGRAGRKKSNIHCSSSLVLLFVFPSSSTSVLFTPFLLFPVPHRFVVTACRLESILQLGQAVFLSRSHLRSVSPNWVNRHHGFGIASKRAVPDYWLAIWHSFVAYFWQSLRVCRWVPSQRVPVRRGGYSDVHFQGDRGSHGNLLCGDFRRPRDHEELSCVEAQHSIYDPQPLLDSC